MVTVCQVGRARAKYKVAAPATTGDPGVRARVPRADERAREPGRVPAVDVDLRVVRQSALRRDRSAARISSAASSTRSATGRKRASGASAITIATFALRDHVGRGAGERRALARVRLNRARRRAIA